jgi:transcriptional regulator with XRE-family HTH domain
MFGQQCSGVASMDSTKARRPVERRNPIDIHVGMRLRMRRTLLGMSQDQLGRALDLAFQQIQKYERGDNRISAGRLFDFCRVLSVPISYFFEDIEPSRADDSAESAQDPLLRRETLELVRAYCRIGNPNTRRGLLQLLASMAPEAPDGKKR